MDRNKQIQQLDLNLLRVFKALYNEQSMTRAAEVLYLTPSAVSHAIKRLRHALDDSLFERRENRMLPTATCRRMAPELIRSLDDVQQLLLNWGDFDPRSSEHEFRIGMHEALEPSVLTQLVIGTSASAPQISFKSIKLERSTLSKDLASGVIDLALDVSIPNKPTVMSQRLLKNEYVVLARSSHPVVTKLNLSSYLDCHHIVVSGRPVGLSIEDSQLQEAGYSRKISIRCQNYSAAAAIVKDTDLLLTVSRSLANRLMQNGLTSCEMPIELPGFATHMYWHESAAFDPAQTWLRNEISAIKFD